MKEKRIQYISVLGVLSMFAVVLSHANGCFWEFSKEGYWLSANIIEVVIYFCIQNFFMISGATLMDYREKYSTKEFFVKRIKKTVIPFAVWSIIGLIFRFMQNWFVLGETSVKEIFERLANTDVISIYWFFPALFGTYLCIPVLAAIPKERRKTIFSYIAIVAFVLNCVIPFVCQLTGFEYLGFREFGMDGNPVYYALRMGIGENYLFYVIVGYLLHEYDLKKPLRYVIYTLGAAGFFTHLCGTYFLSMQAGEIVHIFKGNNNLPAVLHAIAVFVLIKNLIPKMSKRKVFANIIDWIEKEISPYTFSIYLIHFYFLQIAIHILNLNGYSLVYRLVAPVVIFVLCILIAKIIRKIPGGKWILP